MQIQKPTYEELEEQITLVQQNNAILQNKLSQYQFLYSTSKLGILLFSTTGELIDCNPVCLKLFGLETNAELFELHLFKNSFLSSYQMEELNKGVEVQTQIEINFRRINAFSNLKSKKNGISVFDCRICQISQDDNLDFGFMVQISDVTELKILKDKLLRNRNRLKESEKIAHIGNFEINFVTGKQSWSDEVFRILGYAPKSVHPSLDLIIDKVVEQDREMVLLFFDIQNKLQYNSKIEFRIKAINNEIKYLQSFCKLETDENKQHIRFFGILQDVSDNKKVEDALRESQANLEALIENTNDSIWSIDENYRLLAGNSVFYEALNRIVHRKLNTGDSIFISEFSDEQNMQWKGYYDTVLAGEKLIIDIQHTWFDSDLRNMEYRFAPIIKNGGVSGVTVFGRDITQRKQDEENLKRNEAKLQESNATKDRFLSILAHDLKSPFNSILGFSELALKNFRNSNFEKTEQELIYINDISLKTYDLFDNLLQWGRSQTGKIRPEFHSIDFEKTCFEVIDSIDNQAKIKRIKINCFTSEFIQLNTDENMLKTILRNLISNAVKFTFPGGIVSVYAEKGDLETLITVSDTGMGIEEELLKSIWDFTENRSTLGTSKEKGTGLGLLICKEFVEKMGGRIWVESIPNKGCEFVFALPNH